MENNIVAEIIKNRIKEVQEYKDESMSGFKEHLGNKELESMTAALNMAYGMEIKFLSELLQQLGSEDKIGKAILFADEKIEQHTKGSPFSIKSLTPLDAFKEMKTFLQSL